MTYNIGYRAAAALVIAAALFAAEPGQFYQLHQFQFGFENGTPPLREGSNWLRVNSPNVSLMKNITDRYEVRANGLMVIRADADITSLETAELYLAVWGGHPGTHSKRVSVNGRSTYDLPEVGSADGECTHVYPTIKLKLSDLVNGYNAFQFSCEKESGWGHYIVHDAVLRLGLPAEHPRVEGAGLSGFVARVRAQPSGESIHLSLEVPAGFEEKIESVFYQGLYDGYDENGDGRTHDWHGMTNRGEHFGYMAAESEPPYRATWDLSMLRDQTEMAVRGWVHFRSAQGLVFRTTAVKGIGTPPRQRVRVQTYAPREQPVPFWMRANRKRECDIYLDVAPESIEKALLHVSVWYGGAEPGEEYFKLNGTFLPLAPPKGKGPLYYHKIPLQPSLLRRGANHIEGISATVHHGIEVLLPGPALTVRVKLK